MKKIFLIALTFILLLFKNAEASHIAGGDLSYTCLGGNQYQINLNLFVDCLGFDPGAQQSIDFTSTCGGTATMYVDVTNPGGTEISQLCAAQINNSTCNGGNLPGMWVFHFTGTVTLAPPCNTWTMSWTTCCRNAAVLNLLTPDSFGSYIEATLNSTTDTCNNSPSFTSQPIPYVCANQLVSYNYGIVEIDGDSLYYSLIDAMDAGAVNLSYTPGYSASAPIPGITINQTTGLLTFTPTVLGNFVVVIKVQEYDHDGNLKGTVMRDIQFIVQSCTNIVPDPAAGAITGLTGAAIQTGQYSLEMCEGQSFSFNAAFTDSNPGDVLTILSNIALVLPTAVITTSGTNPLVATISWTAPSGSANTNTSFSVTVNDGACPVPGQQTFVYDINVLTRTLAGPDKIICGDQTAALHAAGGNIFTWNVISGPAMAVGTNFSCNPCADPIASPVSTTTYEVVSDLSGTCVNRDTITVNVVPDFSFVTTQTTDTLCLQQLVTLNIAGSPIGTYTYLWSPAAYLNYDTVANPVANVAIAGTYNYYVGITSPLGCLKHDTATITILPPIRTRVGADTILCSTQSTPLHAVGGNTFTWSVLNGAPPIAVGTNFSCNPCANPVAAPTVTTVYQVTSNLGGTCINKDTITVTVVPNFTNTITQTGTVTCLLQQPIQINVATSPADAYSYVWNNTYSLSNYTIPNPLANIVTPGTFFYVVSVTSPLGCVKRDSTSITIVPSYPPNPVAYGSDTIGCPGDTVFLGVTFGTSIPSVCGINPIGCSSPLTAVVGAGTATNSATDWPAPYGNWYTSAKQQFLFKASELIAAGITGGKIDQIDFNVTSIPTSAITTYHQYTINMGCTNATSLSTWIPGLFNVYTPKNHSVTTGWNAHHFDNAYEWDGISNVVVEICFNEGPPNPNYTQNCLSTLTTTSFVSCLYSYSDMTAMCPDLGIPQTSNDRTNIKFHYCGGSPDSSRYTYSWFPPAGIVNHTGQYTGAVLPGQTNYYVIVTDTVSGCLDTAYFHVSATTPSPLVIDAGSNVIICPGSVTTLTATGASFYTWSPPTNLSSIHTAVTNANPTVTTTYTVTGTADCATGPGHDSITVSVLTGGPLIIDAGPDKEVCGAAPYSLSATSFGGSGGNRYFWTIVSGTITDSIHNPHSVSAAFVIPTAENINTYQITVTDTCGNTASDMVVVNALLECKLIIPNVFTPNGDGDNDYFLISGVGIKTYSVVIYNRWGRKVFESNDIKQSWDGKNVNDGTYFYLIKAESINGKQFDEKGYLQRIGK